MMPRNLDRRVEVLVRVADPALRERLDEVIDINLADDQLAWKLDGEGRWHRDPEPDGIDAHERLHELAIERTRDPRYTGGHVR